MAKLLSETRYQGQHYTLYFGTGFELTNDDTCQLRLYKDGRIIINRAVINKTTDNMAFMPKINASEAGDYDGEYLLICEINNAISDTQEEVRVKLTYRK